MDSPEKQDVAAEDPSAGPQPVAADPVAVTGPEPASAGAGTGDAPPTDQGGAGQASAADDDAVLLSEDAAVEAPVDWQDKYVRSVAEMDNVRKRARRDVGLAESRGIARLVKELLPGLDNLERALASAEAQPENADHHLTAGIRLVQQELIAALGRVGVEADAPAGAPFDPHRHEAVAQRPAEGVEPGTIVEVYQAGYRYGEDVIRAAKVVVAS